MFLFIFSTAGALQIQNPRKQYSHARYRRNSLFAQNSVQAVLSSSKYGAFSIPDGIFCVVIILFIVCLAMFAKITLLCFCSTYVSTSQPCCGGWDQAIIAIIDSINLEQQLA